MLKWPFEDTVTVLAMWHSLAMMRDAYPGSYTWRIRFQFGGNSPIARIQDSKNEGVEMGETSFTIFTSDTVVKFLLPVSTTICSTALEFLSPEKRMLTPGNTTVIPSNWNLRLFPSHFGSLIPLLNRGIR